MALASYLNRTKLLLQYPSTNATQLYSDTDLTTWINLARGQLAGESEAIRYMGSISTVVEQRAYNFSGISTGTASVTGIGGPIHVRQMTYNVAEGQQIVYPRNFEWFMQYNMNTPVPVPGPPFEWAQYGQGSGGTSTVSNATGSFYLDPLPDLVYALNVDCVCYPIDLAADGTVEAIPFLWTDAVPFLAAYFALLSSQTSARTQDAERMYNHYTTFVARARQAANPSVNRFLYQQSPDPTMIAKLGMQQRVGGGGQQGGAAQ